MKIFVALVVMMLVASVAWADIEVEILDYPESVLLHSPVFITAQIVNNGSSPVLLAVDRSSANRSFVQLAKANDEFSEWTGFAGTAARDDLIKLNSGGSWLFQADIRPRTSEVGVYKVRAGVQGDGLCVLIPDQAEALEARLTDDWHESEGHIGPRMYKCWEGRAISREVTVEVTEPTKEVDRDARTYIMSSEYPVEIGSALKVPHFDRIITGARDLKERFPTSHYTYVALFYGRREYDWLLETQPNHLLTPYTLMMRAMDPLKPQEQPSGTAMIGTVLPDGLEKYISQVHKEKMDPK